MSKKMSKVTIEKIFKELHITGDIDVLESGEDFYKRKLIEVYEKCTTLNIVKYTNETGEQMDGILPDGTIVLYDTFPEGVDFCGIVVNNMIYATGISKTKFLEIGVATSIEVERAENIRVVIRGDE